MLFQALRRLSRRKLMGRYGWWQHVYAASQSFNDINNQYSEYLKPLWLSRGFTLASVKKMAVREEGYLVQANAFHAGGCDCHAVFTHVCFSAPIHSANIDTYRHYYNMARCSIQHMYTYTPSLREELQSPETKDNPPGGQSIRRDPGTRCRFPRTTKF